MINAEMNLFVGHGSPMNLIAKNQFTEAMENLGKRLRPRALLVISAHWLESGSVFQNAKDQKTIHDFYGFPKQLYDFTYPAHGWSDDLLATINDLEMGHAVFTDARGLDHGAWAVLIKMYPNAGIPVMQLSIPRGLSLPEYFKIGQRLGGLRKHGVLILSSGNLVHNLHQIDWNMTAPAKDWAVEFDQKIAFLLDKRDFDKILTIDSDEKDLFRLAHPTTEHFIPFLYALGAASPAGTIEYPCSFIQNASVSMRSILFA